MKKIAGLSVIRRFWPKALLLSGVLAAAYPASLPAQSWELAWSDEFNAPAGSLPDAATWSYDTGGGGWGNQELEIYCAPTSPKAPCDARRPNAYQDGRGHLVLRAEEREGVWTSARLKSVGKREFRYGRVEARLKLEAAAGFWPAFWMLGRDIDTTGWPAAGEQDIMEWVSSYGPAATSSTVHGPGYSGGKGIGGKFIFPGGGRIDDDQFHTYGVVWSENLLQFYRDDPRKPFLTVRPADLPPGSPWVYNQPFFVLLNFAIGGGGFGGVTDTTTPRSGTMLVDYVRVYQLRK